MLQRCPGSYLFIGNGRGRPMVHNPAYDFNDDILVRGAAYWGALAETWLAAPAASGLRLTAANNARPEPRRHSPGYQEIPMHACPSGTSRTRQVAAAVIGNALEWYDFIVYGFLSSLIARLFFPSGDEYTSLLMALATFGVGFFMRPVGGVLLGCMPTAGDARRRCN